MARLYLVRHAEPAGSWGEHPDPGLSPLGARQAQAVAARLSGTGARRALTSPLQRCRETAAPFLATGGIAVAVEPRVAEIGVPPGEPAPRDWLTRLLSGRWSDAGDLAGWRAQVGAALLACAEDTIVFSHFVAINAAVSLAEGADLVTVFKPGHASVTVLDTDGGARLRLVEKGSEAAVVLT